MKIVVALYYYDPYLSGLAVYTRRLVEGLVERGHDVTLVTSRFDRALEREELVRGVRVRRVPVWFQLDKGAIMPGFVPAVLRAARDADIVNVHLPMAEASAIALWAGKKTVVTYHCDVRLNARGLLGRALEAAIFASTRMALRRSRVVVSQSFDYAANTKVLRHFLDKTVVIPPPIPRPVPAPSSLGAEYFRHRAQVPAGARVIGFVGRIVYEKGIDFLIHAFQDLGKRHDDAYLVVAGDYRHVAGGSVKGSLMRYLSGAEERVRFVGRLSDEELAAFYAFIDVLALPSIDPLEAYGMVQVEAMLAGTPVVATDLPGVRTVVQRTGMGQVVPRRDVHALALAIESVVYDGRFETRTPDEIFHRLDLGETPALYEELFRKVVDGDPV